MGTPSCSPGRAHEHIQMLGARRPPSGGPSLPSSLPQGMLGGSLARRPRLLWVPGRATASPFSWDAEAGGLPTSHGHGGRAPHPGLPRDSVPCSRSASPFWLLGWGVPKERWNRWKKMQGADCNRVGRAARLPYLLASGPGAGRAWRAACVGRSRACPARPAPEENREREMEGALAAGLAPGLRGQAPRRSPPA